MRVRRTKHISLEEILLAEINGAILHPDLYEAMLEEYANLERSDKLCRVPSMLFETYHVTMEQRVAMFKASWEQKNIYIEYLLK